MEEQNTNTLSREDYLRAAQIIASAPKENVPYVIGLLRQGGFPINDEPIRCDSPRMNCDEPIRSSRTDSRVLRIDNASAAIIMEMRKQTGLTMIAIASRLINEGAVALGLLDNDKEGA